MKRKIKFVRNNKTEAFSDGLNKLLGQIHEMTYMEIQTCLAYFSFFAALAAAGLPMASRICVSASIFFMR